MHPLAGRRAETEADTNESPGADFERPGGDSEMRGGGTVLPHAAAHGERGRMRCERTTTPGKVAHPLRQGG